MTNDDSLTTKFNCPQCGAECLRSQTVCWLCHADLEQAPSAAAAIDRPATKSPEQFSFSLSTMLLLMTLASVCFGLLAIAPGLGVPMCVLLVPVLIRTSMVVRRRQAAGAAVSTWEKASLLVGSFGVATVMAAVVSVAAFASFCGVCLTIASTDRRYGGGEMLLWGLGMCAVAFVAVCLTVVVAKWIRRRYRRDTGQEPLH